MASVLIEVTQEDIDNGEVDCVLCPIALAIRRLVRKYAFVAVGDDEINIDDHTTETPIDAAWFIMAFDQGDPVEPFSFPLEIPDNFLTPTR